MSSLPSGLPVQIADHETLGRYCGSSSWFARELMRVQYPAFLPAPDDDTSVYRVTGMTPDDIWGHAELHFVNTRNQAHNHHGVALVEVGNVRSAGIDAIAHEGPPRHANLRGWPKHDDPVLQKSKRKEIATKIADKAKFLAKS